MKRKFVWDHAESEGLGFETPNERSRGVCEWVLGF